MLLYLVAALGLQTPLDFKDGLMLTRVVQGGRVPFPRDSVASDVARFGATSTDAWKPAHADADGWFNVDAGYLACTYEAAADTDMILDAAGDSMVYVNGEPRGGDPYAFGNVRVPIHLHAGKNSFVFAGGRGRVKAHLSPIRAAQQLEVSDLTTPDEISGDKQLFGAIVVLNNTDSFATGLTIRTRHGSSQVQTGVPPIPPRSFRKVRFDFDARSQEPGLELSLFAGSRPLDMAKTDIRIRKPSEQYKRTFTSNIDGSVQYYGVVPALKPSIGTSLVLTLHGAGVEGIGQAQAYAPKDWCWIVAPTNRRAYGFDWEDWGRMDAIEVLDIAEKTLPHDPRRVYLTGHSMGGHGTWSVGTLYPDRFAAIAPSAGWISFWSYAGGWNPTDPTPQEATLRASMNASDTLMRLHNLSDLGVYILHGDADDNVPVEQERTMRKFLEPWHQNLQVHEEPGAGHWWGNQCVDWPGIWSMFLKTQRSVLDRFEFVTPDPRISSDYQGIRIQQLADPGKPGGFHFDHGAMTTDNVTALTTNRSVAKLSIDGVDLGSAASGDTFVLAGKWHRANLPAGAKSASFGGPLKLALSNHMAFVYGTIGTRQENAWSLAKARFDAETWYYRGNGAVDIVSDSEAAAGLPGRNLVLYGNRDSNAAWKTLLADCPIHLSRTGLTLDGRRSGPSAAMFVYPSQGRMIAAVGGSQLPQMRATDRVPVFTSGIAYPDYTIFDEMIYSKGTKGVIEDGFFDSNWHVATRL